MDAKRTSSCAAVSLSPPSSPLLSSTHPVFNTSGVRIQLLGGRVGATPMPNGWRDTVSAKIAGALLELGAPVTTEPLPSLPVELSRCCVFNTTRLGQPLFFVQDCSKEYPYLTGVGEIQVCAALRFGNCVLWMVLIVTAPFQSDENLVSSLDHALHHAIHQLLGMGSVLGGWDSTTKKVRSSSCWA